MISQLILTFLTTPLAKVERGEIRIRDRMNQNEWLTTQALMGEGHLTNSITHNLLGSGEIRGVRVQFWKEKSREDRTRTKG